MNPQDISTAMQTPIRKTLEIVGHTPEEIDQIAPAIFTRVMQAGVVHFMTTLDITEEQLQEIRAKIQVSPTEALKLALSYAKTPDQFQKSVDLAYYEIMKEYLEKLLPSMPQEKQDLLKQELEKIVNI